jgi:hypothetical protein
MASKGPWSSSTAPALRGGASFSTAPVLCGVLACALCAMNARAVNAQEPLRAVVFRTASAAADIDVAAAVDPVVLAQIEARSDLKVAARPALDLPATQIAIDCIGETQACWSAVLAQYTDADALIAPSIQRVEGETIVTFLYADPRGPGEFRTVVGRYRGTNVAHEALDAVPSMLRALLSPAEAEPPADGGTAPALGGAPRAAPSLTAPPTTAASDVGAHAFPIVPVVLLSSAAVIAGAGLAFGLASRHNQNRYDDASTRDPREVDAAIELRTTAHRQATIANVGYGVAAAAFALGATWLIIDLSSPGKHERSDLSASLSPSVSGGTAPVLRGGASFSLLLTGTLPRDF